MCYEMRRFEKIEEEKKQRKKEQELEFSVEDKPEIHVNSRSRNRTVEKV